MTEDLHATRQRLLRRETTASEAVERAIAISNTSACQPALVLPTFASARSTARQVDSAGGPLPRLAGLPFTVKDLFDVAGQVTTAGSRVLAGAPAAQADCPAVARLKAAGGALLGRTHMVEFAFSGVGTNPHYPTPAAWDGRHGHPVGTAGAPRIPGGSSSGAAVSVAAGAAVIGLASDTGGSIRIPAALNGIVGFKSTARLVPTMGALPLSTTLDTVGALTRSVRDAITAHEVLAARTVVRSPAPLAAWRLAVVRTTLLEGLDDTVGRAFDRSLQRLRQAGAEIFEIDLPALAELASMQAQGGFAAAESYAWHRSLIEARSGDYDPRVATRILRGASMMAHEYIDLVAHRNHWIERVGLALASFDAVISPTVPIVPPPISTVAPADGQDGAADIARDAEFFRVNGLLLRNPSIVNMLDGCALTVPCHDRGELPVGLMIWHGALRDDTVLNLGLQIEKALQIQ